MTNEKAVQIVQSSIRDYFGILPDKYTLDTTFAELQLDSLSIVQLIMDIEAHTSLEIMSPDLQHIKSIKDLVEIMEKL